MFAGAAIPGQLLDGNDKLSQPAAAPAFPFNLPFFGQAAAPAGATAPAPAAAAAAVRMGVAKAAGGLLEAVRATRQHGNRGRGGEAGPSGRGAAAALSQLGYAEDAPRLVGRRSIFNRPRNLLPLSGAEPVYDDRDLRWWTVKDTSLHGTYSWAMQDYQSDREDAAVPGDAWRAEMPSDEDLPAVLTCKDFVKQVLLDNKETVQCAFPDKPCGPGHYKVMAFVDPEGAESEEVNFLDYHFYLQHKDVSITLKAGDQLQDVARFFRLPVESIYSANADLKGHPADRPLQRERTLFLPDVNVWSHKPSEFVEPRLYDGAGQAIRNPIMAVPTYSDDEGGVNELPADYCCSFCVKKGQARTGP